MKKSCWHDTYYTYEENIYVARKENKRFLSECRDSYYGRYDYDQNVESIEAHLSRRSLSVDSLVSQRYFSSSDY